VPSALSLKQNAVEDLQPPNLHLAAARVAHVPATAEARVAHTTVAMHPHLLEARQMIPLATKFVLTTASHSIATRALHVVPVAASGTLCDTLEELSGISAATTHITGESTSTETHVTGPAAAAVWDRRLKGSLPVPGTVVVVHTTGGRDIACWEGGASNARAILVCRTGRARHATQPTHTAIAVKPARPEASVAAPVGALRVRLLKGGEMVEVAVLVVDATTHHGPATRLPCTNDSGTVRADTSSLTLGGPNSPNWFLNLDTTAGTNTTHVFCSLLAAASIAAIVTATEARVADTAISMQPHLLEARQMIPLATKFVLTTAGHSIATRALHVVPVAVARLASDALESLGAGCTAPTHVAGEPTSTETHVAPPRTVAHWHGCFEGSLPVPGTVVVVHTTTCCDVACWQVSSCSARAILVCTACCARHATQPTLTAVAVKPARPEASVAAPVGTLRVRLLKGGETVEVARFSRTVESAPDTSETEVLFPPNNPIASRTDFRVSGS
jgi:hypothetical protein